MPSCRRSFTALGCACLLALPGCAEDSIEGSPSAPSAFVQVKDGRVVGHSGAALWLRGVAFGSWFYDEPEPPLEHHDERDFGRVRAMGMNTVRLLLNSRFLEDEATPFKYKDEGFAWLDQNVAWARAHGVYLVPVLHGVPGGTGDCATDPFWEEPEYQDRFVALWRVIAERYAGERTIAGYALMDTPTPTRAVEQWQTLAERTTAAIREVDPDHMLLVGRAHAVACVYDKPAEETFFTVADPNVLYEFEQMQPWDYVAQLLEEWGLQEYGPYPNAEIGWLHGSWDSRPGISELRLKPEETEWTEKQFFYTVTDEKLKYAVPTLQSDFNSGRVYFDDVVIREYDENANLIGTIMDLDLESTEGWYFWQGGAEDAVVAGTGVAGVSSDAHRGNASVTITGTSTYANLSDDVGHPFDLTLGHTYEVRGWVKGENSSPDGLSAIRLNLFGYKSGEAGLNRAGLERYSSDFTGWGQAQGVPLSVRGFGAGRPCFENRGGLGWVRDMLSIMLEKDLHFTYHAYHEPDFGIYRNASGLPDPESVNQPLVDLFREVLR